METLKRKWNSRRGASILLALLFLLVCMMAGVSVLMAAASNAGKIRSNKEEQQKYLTLTSALTLLCDELQSVEYVGRYIITKYSVEDHERGGPSTDEYYTNTTYTYTQQNGELKLRDDSKLNLDDWTNEGTGANLEAILPLFENWDYVFAKQFNKADEKITGEENDNWVIKAYESDFIDESVTNSYNLTLTVDGSSETVNIEVTVSGRDQADTIILRASLEGYPMKVRATLVPTNSKGPNGLELLDDPAILDYEKYENPEDGQTYLYYDNMTDPVTWELVEIVKDGGGTE